MLSVRTGHMKPSPWVWSLYALACHELAASADEVVARALSASAAISVAASADRMRRRLMGRRATAGFASERHRLGVNMGSSCIGILLARWRPPWVFDDRSVMCN